MVEKERHFSTWSKKRIRKRDFTCLVHLGCYTIIPWSLWLIDNKNLFFIVLVKDSKCKKRCTQIWSLVGSHFQFIKDLLLVVLTQRGEWSMELSGVYHKSITGISHFVMLHKCCIFFFTSWRFVKTLPPTSLFMPFSKGTCSPHVSVSYLANSHNTPNLNIFIFVTVISDLWCYYCDWRGRHKPCQHKTANIIDECCVCLTVPLTGHSSISLSSALPISWGTVILNLGQLITLQWLSKVFKQREESHISHFKLLIKSRND